MLERRIIPTTETGIVSGSVPHQPLRKRDDRSVAEKLGDLKTSLFGRRDKPLPTEQPAESVDAVIGQTHFPASNPERHHGEKYPLSDGNDFVTPEQLDVVHESNPGPFLVEGVTTEVDSSNEFTPQLEKKIKTNFREIREEDIGGVMGLFREYSSVRKSPNGREDTDSNHVGHEDITAYIPKNWEDEEQVSRFKEVLKTFYFGGPFDTVARYTGEVLKGVERFTEVCIVDDNEVAAVHSVLTQDPYAPESDRERIADGDLNPAYMHMTLVKRQYREKKIASWFVGRFAKRLMIDGPYDQLTASIDKVGDWAPILAMSESVGFNMDWRPTGKYEYTDANGNPVSGFRMILEKAKWLEMRETVRKKAIEKLGNPQE